MRNMERGYRNHQYCTSRRRKLFKGKAFEALWRYLNRTGRTREAPSLDLLHTQRLILSALDCAISSVGECEQK